MTPEISDHQQELQHLRAQLLEAERSAARAQQAATELHDQLAEAQADIANMKARWYAAEKARNAVSISRKVDTSGLGAHVALIEKERDRAVQAAHADAERAAGRIRTVEQRLSETAASLAESEASGVRSRQRSVLFFSGCLVLSLAWGGTLIYHLYPSNHPVITPSVSAESSVHEPAPQATESSALPQELSRLDSALKRLPNQNREAVLRKVQKHQAGANEAPCNFDWSNGQPTITYGAKANWALTISRCADAIEQQAH